MRAKPVCAREKIYCIFCLPEAVQAGIMEDMMQKRPTTIKQRPTTIPSRPTTTTAEPEFDHKGFSATMQEAYRQIQAGPQVIYRTEPGYYFAMLEEAWNANPIGKAVAMVRKTDRGMRISNV